MRFGGTNTVVWWLGGVLVCLFALAPYAVTYATSVQASLAVLTGEVAGEGLPARSVGQATRDVQVHALRVAGGLALAPVVLTAGAILGGQLGRPLLATFREWLVGARGAPNGVALLLMGGFWLSFLAGVEMVRVLDLNPPGVLEAASEATLWHEVASAVLAGVGEELLVLALPVVLLRRYFGHLSGAGPVVLFVGLVAMRMSYHLYYEAWAFAHLPWAIVITALYLKFGVVWPLILAHAGFNTVQALGRYGLIEAGPLMWGVGVLTATLGLWLLARADGGSVPGEPT